MDVNIQKEQIKGYSEQYDVDTVSSEEGLAVEGRMCDVRCW